MTTRGPSTRCIRDGEPRIKAHDSIPVPIVRAATYGFRDSAELGDHFEGRTTREEYGRYGNPTVRVAEEKLAALEGAEDAALFGSGMAAVTTTLLAFLRSGHHVVLTSDCYRRTRQFVTKTLPGWGVEATVVPPSDPEAIAAAIRPSTRVVMTEVPTNPYLRVLDLPRTAELVHRHRGVRLVVDSTFATPMNLRPLEVGADLVVHSATKYLGGHNDLLAGSVAGSGNLVSVVRDLRGVLGGVLDPEAAFLLVRGLKTLGLRVFRQNESALWLAGKLEAHPRIARVFYPLLASHPDNLVARQLLRGGGGVVSFELSGSLEDTTRFVDATELCTIAPSLGGVETLIEQPALMSFYELSTEEREAIGIRNQLVRLSVGLEDATDLWTDLEVALARTCR